MLLESAGLAVGHLREITTGVTDMSVVLTHVLSVRYRKPSADIKILHIVEAIGLQFSEELYHYLGRFPIVIVRNY